MFYYKSPSQFGGDYQAWFASIANQILRSKLYIQSTEYEIFDVSIYFYSSNFNFPHCKRSRYQKKMGAWFYQEERAKILDITFNDPEDEESFGGILLRGLKKENIVYDSPTKIHNLIRDNLGTDFLNNISGKDVYSGNLRIKLAKDSIFIPHYSLLRENLNPVVSGWSDECSLKSSLFSMRFSTRFPKYSACDPSLKITVALCFLHGYEHEMKLLIGSDFFQEQLNDFLVFLSATGLREIKDKVDILCNYSRFLHEK